MTAESKKTNLREEKLKSQLEKGEKEEEESGVLCCDVGGDVTTLNVQLLTFMWNTKRKQSRR